MSQKDLYIHFSENDKICSHESKSYQLEEHAYLYQCPCCGRMIKYPFNPIVEDTMIPVCPDCAYLIRDMGAVEKTREELADILRLECEKREIEFVGPVTVIGGLLNTLKSWKDEERLCKWKEPWK